jgi:hypothetical protein
VEDEISEHIYTNESIEATTPAQGAILGTAIVLSNSLRCKSELQFVAGE